MVAGMRWTIRRWRRQGNFQLVEQIVPVGRFAAVQLQLCDTMLTLISCGVRTKVYSHLGPLARARTLHKWLSEWKPFRTPKTASEYRAHTQITPAINIYSAQEN